MAALKTPRLGTAPFHKKIRNSMVTYRIYTGQSLVNFSDGVNYLKTLNKWLIADYNVARLRRTQKKV